MQNDCPLLILNSDEKTSHALGHEFLPNPSKHFRFLVIGSSGSGKSIMIRNLVERPELASVSTTGRKFALSVKLWALTNAGTPCLKNYLRTT